MTFFKEKLCDLYFTIENLDSAICIKGSHTILWLLPFVFHEALMDSAPETSAACLDMDGGEYLLAWTGE